mmetsp:Transcript_25513/g.40005  ORF Transcript_25513/g.40005 Transcript_25513/m.40005 type:complete len:120 (-) Transcript_25513:827-1186(-)
MGGFRHSARQAALTALSAACFVLQVPQFLSCPASPPLSSPAPQNLPPSGPQTLRLSVPALCFSSLQGSGGWPSLRVDRFPAPQISQAPTRPLLGLKAPLLTYSLALQDTRRKSGGSHLR